MYQDFAGVSGADYALEFNWQSWGAYTTPTTSELEISLTDPVTGAVLFDGLYTYDGNGPHPVHDVLGSFVCFVSFCGSALESGFAETRLSGLARKRFSH